MKKYVTYEVMFVVEDGVSSSEIEEQLWANDWDKLQVVNTTVVDFGEIEEKGIVIL